MGIADKDFKNGFICAFQFAVKTVSYYLHVPFLETCKSYKLCPAGLSISKKPFIEFETEDLKVLWKEALIQSEKDLLETLCIGICERLTNIEGRFWAELQQLQENNTDGHFKEWLVRLLIRLEKKIKKITKTKRKKLEKLANHEYLKKLVRERFDGHLDLFTFRSDLLNYCENFRPDIVNIANLVTLNSPTRSSLKITNYNNGNISGKEEVNLSDPVPDRLSNAVSLEGNRCKANFVSPNVINLSKRNLTKD